jgi:hypothetical protein
MRFLPPLVTVDGCEKPTHRGNCNGGFYAIPRRLCQRVDKEWRRWASWLLENLELLRAEGKGAHVDQVAMWLAIHVGRISYKAAHSNLNYYIHFAGGHRHYDARFEIAVLHYHDVSLNARGLIEPKPELNSIEMIALQKANNQIACGNADSMLV